MSARPFSYFGSSLALSVLFTDAKEYRRESDYLMELLDHTEVYREQAAFLWLERFKHKLSRSEF